MLDGRHRAQRTASAPGGRRVQGRARDQGETPRVAGWPSAARRVAAASFPGRQRLGLLARAAANRLGKPPEQCVNIVPFLVSYCARSERLRASERGRILGLGCDVAARSWFLISSSRKVIFVLSMDVKARRRY